MDTANTVILFSLFSAVAGIAYGLYLTFWVLRQSLRIRSQTSAVSGFGSVHTWAVDPQVPSDGLQVAASQVPAGQLSGAARASLGALLPADGAG